eukprot:c1182_g1_i1 orf=265-1353(+)
MSKRISTLIPFMLVLISVSLVDIGVASRTFKAVMQQLRPNAQTTLRGVFGKSTGNRKQLETQKTFSFALSSSAHALEMAYRVQMFDNSSIRPAETLSTASSQLSASSTCSFPSAGPTVRQGKLVQPQKDDPRMNKGVLITIIVVPVCFGVIMVSSLVSWICQGTSLANRMTSACTTRQHLDLDVDTQLSDGILSFEPWLRRLNSFHTARKVRTACALDYAVLQAATNNFSSDNLLGRGGSGCAYKARLNEDFLVAVKKLHEDGRHIDQDFQTEIDLMSKVRHENLVSLLGFCIYGQQRFLVYELMQNGSLDEQLHGYLQGSSLSWHLRMKIALDAARGLEHLHEHCSPPVIHRDFKSSNILL